MDKRENNNPPVFNFNIQVNINSQSPIQNNIFNIKTVVEKKEKSQCHSWLAGMFKALVEFLSSIDPNIIIMLIAMMFGIRL